jgi:hypothetical protein
MASLTVPMLSVRPAKNFSGSSILAADTDGVKAKLTATAKAAARLLIEPCSRLAARYHRVIMRAIGKRGIGENPKSKAGP